MFVILLSQDGFKCDPENKVSNNHFIKSVQKQLYADILHSSFKFFKISHTGVFP